MAHASNAYPRPSPCFNRFIKKTKQEALPLTIKEVGETVFYRIKKHLQHEFYRIDFIKNEIYSPIKDFYMKDMKAVVVFTGKDLNIMRTEGGQATGMPEQTGSTMPITS